MIQTSACRILGIEHPVVQAGMGGSTNPALVAAVSEAGGLGVLACSWTEPDSIRAEIADIRSRTKRPFGVNFVLGHAPQDRIDLAIEERVPVISLARGTDPSEIIGRAHAAGLVAMHQITTVEEARVSLKAGVDVLIAQGREAGGHVGPHPLWTLLPQVVDIAGAVPVLAAGGLVAGRDLAAALTMGAAGIYMGTRFQASVEAPISDQHKAAIVAARDGSTVASKMWDMMYGTSWPGVAVRALRNSLTEKWAGREAELVMALPGPKNELEEAHAKKDYTKIEMMTGEGSARVDSILPAAEIVRMVIAEAEAALRNAAKAIA